MGCGSKREFATCEGVCRERKLELVSGGDYDELVVAAGACRVRIRCFLPLVEELAATGPQVPDGRKRYESFRERARLAVRGAGPGVREKPDGASLAVEPQVVWRCPDCGGVEAPQPCIGVCIWQPLDWVEADVFQTERVRALRDMELERALHKLLARLARVTPRDGEWVRNWRAFQAEARRLIGSQG